MKRLFKTTFVLGIMLLFAGSLKGQDLVFEFINPAFGGNTFNYQWLLSSADAQNTFEEPTDLLDLESDPLQEFADDLNRQILNQLSRQLISDQFGEEGLQEGNYLIGSYEISVTSGTDGITVSIVDLDTGGQTSITVPYF
jgi:curli production assembly/transport component CsgF